MKDYIVNIVVPYVTKKREDLRLPCDHHALVIYDKFKGQCTPAILQLLEENNIDVVFVPANCTDRLQPLDVSVNKAAKHFSSKDGMLTRYNSRCMTMSKLQLI